MASGKESEEQDYVLLRSDRRKNLRKQILVLKVKGEGKKGVFFGYAKTLSTGGMFITSVNPHKLGEEFDLTFTLSGEGADIRCRCVVVWQREYVSLEKKEPGMGLKFLDLSPEIKEKISDWLKKR